jgi:hypothetical protein
MEDFDDPDVDEAPFAGRWCTESDASSAALASVTPVA